MPEKFAAPFQSEVASQKTIEQSANFEGNYSEILFERLRNPVIREQLIDLLHKEQLAKDEYYKMEPFSFHITRANGGKVFKDHEGKHVLERTIKSFVPKSKEKLEKELDVRLKRAMSATRISFSDKSQPPSERDINLLWENPYTGKRLTPKQTSLVEAHEKGHNLRKFSEKFYREYFARGFDASKVVFTEEDLTAHRARYSEPDARTEEQLIRDTRAIYIDYLFSADEIVERMSQLKNYFGMRDADQFTHDHLEYAREHYLKDVGFNNGMDHFFQSITPQTEENFLKLINNSGV